MSLDDDGDPDAYLDDLSITPERHCFQRRCRPASTDKKVVTACRISIIVFRFPISSSWCIFLVRHASSEAQKRPRIECWISKRVCRRWLLSIFLKLDWFHVPIDWWPLFFFFTLLGSWRSFAVLAVGSLCVGLVGCVIPSPSETKWNWSPIKWALTGDEVIPSFSIDGWRLVSWHQSNQWLWLITNLK